MMHKKIVARVFAFLMAFAFGTSIASAQTDPTLLESVETQLVTLAGTVGTAAVAVVGAALLLMGGYWGGKWIIRVLKGFSR